MVVSASSLVSPCPAPLLRLVPPAPAEHPQPARWWNDLDGEVVEVTGEPQEGLGEAPYRLGGLWFPCVVLVHGADRGCPAVGARALRWLDGPGWRQVQA